MENKGFYLSEMIRFGWRKMKEHLVYFAGVLLIVWLVMGSLQYLAEGLFKELAPLRVSFQVLYFIFSLLFPMGLIKIALKLIDEEKPGLKDLPSGRKLFFPYLLATILYGLLVAIGTILKDLLSGLKLFFPYLLATILYAVMVLVGLILLIVPGIFLAIKFSFYPYFIVDKKLGPLAALKASSDLTAGVKWDLMGFYLVCGAVNLLGFCCLVVGLFASVPTALMATALVYRRLLPQSETPKATGDTAIAA